MITALINDELLRLHDLTEACLNFVQEGTKFQVGTGTEGCILSYTCFLPSRLQTVRNKSNENSVTCFIYHSIEKITIQLRKTAFALQYVKSKIH